LNIDAQFAWATSEDMKKFYREDLEMHIWLKEYKEIRSYSKKNDELKLC
jgi:hypothetical protein